MDGTCIATHRQAWNKGKLVGHKTPFKLQEVWAIRIRLQMQGRLRELALLDLGIDSTRAPCTIGSGKSGWIRWHTVHTRYAEPSRR